MDSESLPVCPRPSRHSAIAFLQGWLNLGTLFLLGWPLACYWDLPVWLHPPSLPHKVKTQYVYYRLYVNYFLYLRKFLKKLADNQCCPITKGSIYHIKHVHTTIYHGSGLI